MKLSKLSLATGFCALALLAACDDSSTSSSSSGGIVGTWTKDTTITEEGNSATLSVLVNFKSDSTMKSIYKISAGTVVITNDTTSGSYSISGNKINLIEICTADQVENGACEVLRDTTEGTWSISGNKLTLTTVEDGESETVVLTKK